MNCDQFGNPQIDLLKNTYVLLAIEKDDMPLENLSKVSTERYHAVQEQASSGSALIPFKFKKFILTTNKSKLDGYSYLPISKVERVLEDGSVLLDTNYIAPYLSMINSHMYTHVFIEGILQKMEERILPLSSSFITDRGISTDAVLEAQLLQTLNRYKGIFYLYTMMSTHPREFYQNLLYFVCEVATFTHSNRSINLDLVPPYDHNNSLKSLTDLCAILFQLLSTDIQKNAQIIPLFKENYIYYTEGKIESSDVENSVYILEVQADVPRENMTNFFSGQCKVAAKSDIMNHVKGRSTAVAFAFLSNIPQDIILNHKAVYFELLKEPRSAETWEMIASEGGIAFHPTGEYPNLTLKLWQVRK